MTLNKVSRSFIALITRFFIQLCRSRDKQAYRGRKKVVRREEEVAREGRREDH